MRRALFSPSGGLVKASLDFGTTFQSGGLENDVASLSFSKFYEQESSVDRKSEHVKAIKTVLNSGYFHFISCLLPTNSKGQHSEDRSV